MIVRTALVVASLALPAALARAEERPSEADLFGAPAQPADAAPAQGPVPPPPPPPAGEGRDEAILGGEPRGRPPAGVLTAAQENPLAIGGLVYLRAAAQWNQSVAPSRWPLDVPSLVDLYVDTRPNDRVRAFALARTFWDPVAPPAGASLLLPSPGPDPHAVLDQLWVNFDVGRKAFVTVGKQHVKWGVGRFWNPTDYLHPERLAPLAIFDARAGATMAKVHVPWEAKGWNFYGVALLDDPAGKKDAASTVGKVAGGARAEVVLGTAELGADALVRRGQKPRFGLDFSAGLWDLDVHGEVAIRTGSDVQLWEEVQPGGTILTRYAKRDVDGVLPQAVLGVSYAVNYSDQDAVRFGAEYFYNAAGYDDPHIYPWLLLNDGWSQALGVDVAGALGYPKGNDLVFNYVGRQYGGFYVLLAQPGSWNDTSFTLSAIANLSDGTARIQLDHSVVVNTYLTVETFLSGNVGKEGGEFRFSLDVPPQNLNPDPLGVAVYSAPLRTPPPVMAGGVALRVKL